MRERLDSAFEIAQDAIDRGNQYLAEKEKLLFEIAKLKLQRRKMQRAARKVIAWNHESGFYERYLYGEPTYSKKACPHCYRVAHPGEECR